MIRSFLLPWMDAALTKVKRRRHAKLLNWRYNLVAEHIAHGRKVLDQGAGPGRIGERLAHLKDCRVRLVDVLDCNETGLPFTVYDGRRLPFANREFDVTLLIFVLHHTLNQEALLCEAARVSREKIIVVEDTPRNRFELAVNKCCDAIGSIKPGYGNPYNYRSTDQWRRMFTSLDLILIHQAVVKPFWPYYHTKTVFVLSP